jgi:hypothetical protein
MPLTAIKTSPPLHKVEDRSVWTNGVAPEKVDGSRPMFTMFALNVVCKISKNKVALTFSPRIFATGSVEYFAQHANFRSNITILFKRFSMAKDDFNVMASELDGFGFNFVKIHAERR